jgi:hypothetical protein
LKSDYFFITRVVILRLSFHAGLTTPNAMQYLTLDCVTP